MGESASADMIGGSASVTAQGAGIRNNGKGAGVRSARQSGSSDDKIKIREFCILDVLIRHSDNKNHLKQQEVLDYLDDEFGLSRIDRKTLGNYVERLNATLGLIMQRRSDENEALSANEAPGKKMDRNSDLKSVGLDFSDIDDYDSYGEAFSIKVPQHCVIRHDKTGYWFCYSVLTDEQLQELIECVLFSRALSRNAAEDIISRLQLLYGGCSDADDRRFSRYIRKLQDIPHSANKGLSKNIVMINKAIETKKQISFNYSHYDSDGKLVPKMVGETGGTCDNNTGKSGTMHKFRDYVMSPYEIIAGNGYFYLVGYIPRKNAKEKQASIFRLDKVGNVKVLDDDAVNLKELEDMKEGFYSEHYAEHAYMFPGKAVPIHMVVNDIPAMCNALADWFGKAGRDFKVMRIKDENTAKLDVRLKCNEQAMHYWAMLYGDNAEIITPKSLRDSLAESAKAMAERYRQ